MTRYPLYSRLNGPRAGLDGAVSFAFNGVRSADGPTCSESLYWLRYPGSRSEYLAPSGRKINTCLEASERICCGLIRATSRPLAGVAYEDDKIPHCSHSEQDSNPEHSNTIKKRCRLSHFLWSISNEGYLSKISTLRALDRDKRRAFVNTTVNFWVP